MKCPTFVRLAQAPYVTILEVKGLWTTGGVLCPA